MHRRTTHPLGQRFLQRSSLVVLGIGLLLQAPRVVARDAQHAPPIRCTVQNVAGSYGLSGNGTIVSNPFGLPEGPVATVGVITFDEQGDWVSLG